MRPYLPLMLAGSLLAAGCGTSPVARHSSHRSAPAPRSAVAANAAKFHNSEARFGTRATSVAQSESPPSQTRVAAAGPITEDHLVKLPRPEYGAARTKGATVQGDPNRRASLVNASYDQSNDAVDSEAAADDLLESLVHSAANADAEGMAVGLSAGAVYAHNKDHSWVQGKLIRIHSGDGYWQIRYAGYDEVDAYGGKVILSGQVSKELAEGDIVRVYGQVMGHDRWLRAHLYRVQNLKIIQRVPRLDDD